MKKAFPFVFGISLVLNVALAAWFWQGANSTRGQAAADVGAKKASAAAAVVPVERKVDASTWTDLEPGNLPAMAAHMRESGFPPEVVRAVIKARLGEEYVARRRQLDPDEATRPFWKARPADPKINAELSRLGREHAKTLRELTGEDTSDPWAAVYQSRQMAGVPGEKADDVKKVVRDYDELRSEIYGAGVLTPADRDKLTALNKAQQADLAQVLSPGELLEYNLRTSQTAERMRYQLSAFGASEEEFRAIYQMQVAFDEQFGLNYGNLSREQQQQRSEANKKLNEQIKTMLGPERGLEYERSLSYDYRLTSQLAARLNLPADAANQVWAVQQDTQQRLNALASDRSLSGDQRNLLRSALLNEAQTKITTTLGDRGFEAYKQYGGQWLQMFQAGDRSTATAGTFIFRP